MAVCMPNCLCRDTLDSAVFPGHEILYEWGQDANRMSSLTSILTLRQSVEATVAWAIQRLIARGFQVELTFDLHAARMSQVDCPCPYHGTGDCTCQMVVLLIHRPKALPVTIVVHGHDDRTSLSLVDMANQSTDESIIQALLSVIENSEI